MRVLVLCKRYSTGKDSAGERYGRLFHLPAGLARNGWDVEVLSLSYRLRSVAFEGLSTPGFAWQDVALNPAGLLAYRRSLQRQQGAPPDVVWSSSDALHAVLGDRIARALRRPHVIDLYDDYEAFGMTRLPGMRQALRSACRRAAGLTVVSRTLIETCAARMAPLPAQHHLPNGVIAAPLPFDRAALLRRLGLGPGVRLVGAVGALDASRGIDDLFEAFEILAASHPEVHLLLVGREYGPTLARRHPRIHRLGVVPHAEALAILAALDVSVVCNRDGAFARACHPMKLVESAMVGTPVVAAAVGEVARLLDQRPESLYPPGDAAVLAAHVAGQLVSPRPPDPALARSWDDLSRDLGRVLDAAAGAG